jgi:soluble lytic murein transglycosylase
LNSNAGGKQDRQVIWVDRLSTKVPTLLLAGFAAAGVLAFVLQADSAGGQPAPKPQPEGAQPKDSAKPSAKDAAKKDTAKKDAAKQAAKTNSKETAKKDAKAGSKDTAKANATSAKAAATSKSGTTGTTHAAATGPRFAIASTDSTSSVDIAALKEAVSAARRGRASQAEDLQKTISDPVARKLVEWAILRSDDTESIEFNRYMAFIAENPSWPAVGVLRRRAEATLWSDRRDPAFVRAFFANGTRACASSASMSAANRVDPTCGPTSTKGKFALARALLLQGDRASAQSLVREAWRSDNFSGELENLALDVFGELITSSDHKARMDMRLYVEDADGALRAANRAGGNAPAIAKARIAVFTKASNAKALLDALPAESHRDVGVIFSHVQLLRRADKATEAAQLILSIPHEHGQAIDTDQWWVERRLVSRKLLDLGDAKTAYRIARDAAIPSRDNYRAEHQFTTGWIALRFLNDPAAALAHFAKVGQGNSNPITLARAGYWQGRALEALGRNGEARGHYEAAARYSTAYYGQIARARLGHKEIIIRPPPEPTPDKLEVARAVELLYAIDERDLIAGALAELGERGGDPVALSAIGEVATRYKDARASLLLGKGALSRGLPLEHYAFPTVGLPEYRAIGPAIEPAVAYAIARQESTFNQKTVSSARAMGLMQVTPAAGRYVAKKFGAPYDEKRILSDQVYNMQLGAAELGDLIVDYRGSYILTFVGYNAGRGRVKEWIEKFGDPRDPKVDPIDWVERIPFSETRNYVQRVLENLQVYRVRFGGGSRLLIEADLHRGAAEN